MIKRIPIYNIRYSYSSFIPQPVIPISFTYNQRIINLSPKYAIYTDISLLNQYYQAQYNSPFSLLFYFKKINPYIPSHTLTTLMFRTKAVNSPDYVVNHCTRFLLNMSTLGANGLVHRLFRRRISRTLKSSAHLSLKTRILYVQTKLQENYIKFTLITNFQLKKKNNICLASKKIAPILIVT